MNSTPVQPSGLRYQHTQPGSLIHAATLLPAVVMAAVALTVPAMRLPLAPMAGVLLLVDWFFGALTIEVGGGDLRWRFGPGLIRKRIALADIATVETVRTCWLEGWGIHYTRRGWLYNVSGFGAVLVRLKSGKQFMLGSDEPDALCRALREALRV